MRLAHLLPDAPTQEQALAAMPPAFAAHILKSALARRADCYITNHPASQQMIACAKLIAFRPEPVLITGPSGTGKEMIARMMLGNRPDYAFFPVNCAGLVDTLFESLLFGHKRGAFTGAQSDKPGILVTARDGVVFFDEIGELPLNQQAKLLRVIQERRVLPVGSDSEVPIQCRFVFATNRNLPAEVAERRFREDLYYRICAVALQTYPLSARPDDAILIADSITTEDDEPVHRVPDAIINSGGNVRALENWIVQRRVFGVGNDGINPAVGDNC